jgi:predicted transposase/invertase (TIGR01784 family)
MKFIDPRIDFAFNRIFGGEDTKDILKNFIESLLDLSGNKKLKDITLLDPFSASRITALKFSLIDMQCTDMRGISYVVEMQVKKSKAFFKTIQYNAAKTYTNSKGEDYPKLNQVIAVTITGFTLFEELDAYLTRHATRETETGTEYPSEIIYYVVELSKFEKKIETLENVLDKWIWFIKYASEIEEIPDDMKEGVFVHAFEKAMMANMTPLELEYYDKASMAIADAVGALELAKEEGMEKGKEEGRKECWKELKQKQQKSIAKKMKEKGYSADEIADLTGLPIPEIEKL